MSAIRKQERVASETPDIAAERVAALEEIFPEAFSEGTVDFTRLRAALGDMVTEGPERYSFTWAGKRSAIRVAQTPSAMTLAPDRDASLHFDETPHAIIEGDNLEVLKILYKSYHGRVKMIYIDPPYNLDNDFVYHDDFAAPRHAYLRQTGQIDSNGDYQTSNIETGGRKHSNWLTMMYPRLFLARQLLRDDGVIFVSIDDIEIQNLRLLMNEIFGEENFLGQITWHNSSRSNAYVTTEHEYILVFARSLDHLGKPWRRQRLEAIELLRLVEEVKESGDTIAHAEQQLRAAISRLLQGETGERSRTHTWLTNYGNVDDDWRIYYPVDLSGEGAGPPRRFGDQEAPAPPGRHWMGQDYIDELYENGRIVWRGDRAYRKLYIEESEESLKAILEFPTRQGSEFVKSLLGKDVFDKPKPTNLVKHLIRFACEKDSLILDFFAGSGTTAQAVLEVNQEDSGTREFVLVQLPERTPEGSPARAAGYETIADITRERVRRVVAHMESNKVENSNQVTPPPDGTDARLSCLYPRAVKHPAMGATAA